jgi:hypothetical protein
MGFGKMTGFIGLFDTASDIGLFDTARDIGLFDTAREYALQFTITHTLVPTITSSLQLLDSGFQRQTFPFLWVLELSPAPATRF